MRLNEGGHAVPGAEPVAQEDSLRVADEIIAALAKAGMRARAAGSAGKKPDGESSGDLDIIVQKSGGGGQRGEILACLRRAQGRDGHAGNAGGQIHWGWEYEARGGGRRVAQVDLEIVPDLEMAAFFRRSPDFRKGESSWKGMFRTALLVQLAKTCPLDKRLYPESKFSRDDGAGEDFAGTPKEFWTYSLMARGLYLKRKSYAGRRQPRVARPRTVEERLVSRDPGEIVRIVLGPRATEADASTLERLLDYALSAKYPHRDARTLSRIFYRMAYGDLVFRDNGHADLKPERKRLFRYLLSRMEAAGLEYSMPDCLDDLKER